MDTEKIHGVRIKETLWKALKDYMERTGNRMAVNSYVENVLSEHIQMEGAVSVPAHNPKTVKDAIKSIQNLLSVSRGEDLYVKVSFDLVDKKEAV